MTDVRQEHDFLGELAIPADSLAGIHTARARENFPLTGQPVHPELVEAYGQVKLACALTNQALGVWRDDGAKADAIIGACNEMADGLLTQHLQVDMLQGGAGTSTNMNVNEVLANRALQLLGQPIGRYDRVSPTDDVNRHQSTNDTYPTALKVATMKMLTALEERLVALAEAFQAKEKQFAHVVKIGRTQFQDAVLTTLGREMGAYAEAFNRDRWRLYKCQERLRVVNLGGTAIGTGLAAPRQYVFRVVDTLRQVTGLPLARAENLMEATQNADVFVEVSGILKASAATLLKVATDLRLLSSGPQAGLGEINLPQRQAGSSIMPGKVNPVIPEAVSQVAMSVIGHDAALTQACAAGTLELNPFLPLVAACLLNNCQWLTAACDIFRRLCVDGITANEQTCRAHVDISTATVTALLAVIGYEHATQVAAQAAQTGKTIRDIVLQTKLLTPQQYDDLTSPEAVCRLGMPDTPAQPRQGES